MSNLTARYKVNRCLISLTRGLQSVIIYFRFCLATPEFQNLSSSVGELVSAIMIASIFEGYVRRIHIHLKSLKLIMDHKSAI